MHVVRIQLKTPSRHSANVAAYVNCAVHNHHRVEHFNIDAPHVCIQCLLRRSRGESSKYNELSRCLQSLAEQGRRANTFPQAPRVRPLVWHPLPCGVSALDSIEEATQLSIQWMARREARAPHWQLSSSMVPSRKASTPVVRKRKCVARLVC